MIISLDKICTTYGQGGRLNFVIQHSKLEETMLKLGH